jgi:regulator of protease activity HflC (stomatin/prohibitin superfamily)
MKNVLIKLQSALAVLFGWTRRITVAGARRTWTLVVRGARSRFARATTRFTLRTARVTGLAAAIAALALLFGWIGFHRVPPGTIGVKQVNFGGGGIVREDYPSGLHYGLKGYHSWHAIDGRTQMISFGWSDEPADAEHLKVRTANGNYVRIGLAVPFRVKRGEAHQLVEDGLKSTYRQRVQTAVEKTLTTELGRLSTEEFWDTDRRNAALAEALPKLNRDLAPLHVEAQDVLIELFRFNPEYENRQQQIQQDALKAIVDQTKKAIDTEQRKIDQFLREVERAESDLTIELKKAIDTEHDAGRKRIEAKLAEARYYDQTRKAQATAEYERLVNEGEREVAQAEQLRIAAENQSYGSLGGKLLLARQAAENLHIQQVTLNSNDPKSPSVLDLDELVRLLVGTAKAEGK